MGGNTETKFGVETEGYPVTVPPWDPPHIQLPNPHTILDAKNSLLTGALYSCLSPEKLYQCLTNTEWSTGSPTEELEKGPKKLKGFAAP